MKNDPQTIRCVASRWQRLCVAYTLALAGAGLLTAQGAAIDNYVTTLNPAADAHVRTGTTGDRRVDRTNPLDRRNFGTDPQLEVRSSPKDGTSEAYVQFDASSLAPIMDSARLRVYARLGEPGTVSVLVRSVPVTTWTENQLAWREKPDHDTTLGNLPIVGVSAAWYQLDVTKFVEAQLAAGKSRFGLVLVQGDNSNNKVSINSREAQDKRPELVVARAPFKAKIAFFPAEATGPDGYLADHGGAYDKQAKGLTYGWNVDNTEFMRDRTDKKGNETKKIKPGPSRAHEVFAYLDNPKMQTPVFWELAVPNGAYKVKILVGDLQNKDGVFGINVEDVQVIDGVPESGKHWFESTKVVQVKDGKLTVTNHPDSSGNKICNIEVSEVAPETTLTANRP